MNITPIPDKEAASLLGVHFMTIRKAVDRGDLIRVPMAGRLQHVAKEQVELFHGKKLLRNNLNGEDRKTWENIETAILHPGEQKINDQPAVTQPQPTPNVSINMDPDLFVRALVNNGLITADKPLSFHSALAGEARDQDEREEGLGGNGLLFILIVLGLIWLFSQVGKAKEEATRRAERTIEQIGLEREDLYINQREVIATLKKRPQEARELKRIIDSSGYQNPLAVA